LRILQQHLDFIEYEPKEKEIAAAEEADKTLHRYEEIVVLFASVEKGDDDSVAKKAVEGTREFLKKLGVNKIIIYPYAHLSQNLARPKDALEVLKAMERYSKEAGIETYRSPFGWNKAFQIKVKGHPLAEQSRVYSAEGPVAAAPVQAAQAPAGRVSTDRKPTTEMTEEQMLARIKKSDFSGLADTDHRIIGEQLDLFSFQEPSPGMVYWHDKGVKLRNILIEFIRGELAKLNYIEISAPVLANTILWKVSGHWDHYKDNMFITHLGDEEFGLKPMGCPSVMLFYRTRRWSFRDLPLKVADFDALHRNELSGVATGLFRVKMLTQDDAHIFVTEEQIEDQIKELITLVSRFYGVFGLTYSIKISTMPDDHIGTKEQWDKATESLKKVVTEQGLAYQIKEKEGAFYGPKIDIDIKDSIGREWQCATIQLDYQQPRRFRLTYTGSDGKDHTPVVIHRVVYGSLERFIGILIEHYKGKFPVWVSPVQVRVISVSDESTPYAREILEKLKADGIRAEADFQSGTVGAKIREARLQRVPYSLVIGSKEKANGTWAVRERDQEVRYGVQPEEFMKELREKIKNFA
jgi:threonyl-tRNA synthetase